MSATNRVVVTGVTGFLGSHIGRRLAAEGAQVTGAVRSPEKGAWLESEGISLEAIKRAEKEACHVIRLVETRGRRSAGLLQLAGTGARLVETDLLEWSDGPAHDGPDVELTLRPFEIRTYKIVYRADASNL